METRTEAIYPADLYFSFPEGKSITGFLTQMGNYQEIARWHVEIGKVLSREPGGGEYPADTVVPSHDGSKMTARFGIRVERLRVKQIAPLGEDKLLEMARGQN